MIDRQTFFEQNSLFWSRLGFENDPPRYDESGKLIEFRHEYQKFAGLHKKMHNAGIRIHTSPLFSGWVGPDSYDYTLTDDALETLFREVPDALYIPRVKLNAPVEWQKKHPEELFVYWGGNNDPEYIRSRVGTSEHDLLGTDTEEGYCDDKLAICSSSRENFGLIIESMEIHAVLKLSWDCLWAAAEE